MSLTFAGLVYTEKLKNSLGLLLTTKKWLIHISTWQRWGVTTLHNINNLLHSGKYIKRYCACLSQVYQRLDQPITSLNLFKQGLDHFPGEVTLLTGIARIHEVQHRI